MVEQVVGRVLGRPVHGDQERIAWSIVIAGQGLPAFIDALIDSPEYMETFGEDLVPHQRARMLAGQSVGTMPFNQQAPRYDAYWRDTMALRAPAVASGGWAGWPRPAKTSRSSPVARSWPRCNRAVFTLRVRMARCICPR